LQFNDGVGDRVGDEVGDDVVGELVGEVVGDEVVGEPVEIMGPVDSVSRHKHKSPLVPISSNVPTSSHPVVRV
jgi:hypothetical protein